MDEAMCPCGGGAYAECCGPLHEGAAAAQTPEALMRSRYSAFAKVQPQYLVDTRHASTRGKRSVAEVEAACRSREWAHLAILETSPGAHEDEGFVTFRAVFVLNGERGYTQERSRFLREDGLWTFVSSEFQAPELADADPCWCRQGQTWGACHGAPA